MKRRMFLCTEGERQKGIEATAGNLAELLKGKKVIIVGVGNRLRGDDGVGSVVAEQLQAFASPNAIVIDAETVPENYLGVLLDAKPDVVLFIDAVDFGGKVGEWVLVPISVLGDKAPSTHTVSLKLLGQILESNGVDSWLLAVQPGQIGFGASMSETVASTSQNLIDLLTQLIAPASKVALEVCGDE